MQFKIVGNTEVPAFLIDIIKSNILGSDCFEDDTNSKDFAYCEQSFCTRIYNLSREGKVSWLTPMQEKIGKALDNKYTGDFTVIDMFYNKKYNIDLKVSAEEYANLVGSISTKSISYFGKDDIDHEHYYICISKDTNTAFICAANYLYEYCLKYDKFKGCYISGLELEGLTKYGVLITKEDGYEE